MIDENWLNEIFPNLKKDPSSKKKKNKKKSEEENASFVEEIFHTDSDLNSSQEDLEFPSEDDVVLAREEPLKDEDSPLAATEEDELISADFSDEKEADDLPLEDASEISFGDDLSSEDEEEPKENTEPEEEEMTKEALGEEDEFEEEEYEEEDGLSEEEEEENSSVDAPLSAGGAVYDWIKSFLLSLTAVIFIFTLLFRGVTVSGDSMLPTLENSEYLVISDLFYTPKTGDIVVVQAPQYKNGTEPLIKRIIATEGQTVRIHFKTWQVWVDDVLLNEEYVYFENGNTMSSHNMKVDENGYAQITVAENCVFLMGDHRNDSLDSRSDTIGQVDVRYIMGRVVLRLFPVGKFGAVD